MSKFFSSLPLFFTLMFFSSTALADLAPIEDEEDENVSSSKDKKGSDDDDGCQAIPGRSAGYWGLLPLAGALCLRRRKN